MLSRRAIAIAAAAVGVVAAAVAADWLIVTDEERLEDFVDAVTGRIDHERIDRALGWTDPAKQPLELTFRGHSLLFDQENAGDLRPKAYTHLSAYQGERLNLMHKSIEVQGAQARVMVDTLSRRGRTTVDFDLRKLDDRWVVSSVRVR